MEWLLLVLLVPAIVVPVVLLWGFAGCQIFFPLDEHPPPPPAPQQLEATPSSTTSISLTWMHSGVGVQFEVQRAADGGPFEFLGTVPAPPFLDPPSFGTPPPLEPGVTYHYQIFAVDSQSRSEGSNIADARPLAFQFDLSSGNNQNRAGDTIVQKIGSNLLKNWGAVVRIHLRGTPGDPLIIDSIYMSGVATATADNPTPDAWDSAGDIKLVASAVTVPANSSQVVNSSNPYTIPNPPADLLIAFDINSMVGRVRSETLTGTVSYTLNAQHQASLDNRFPNPDNPAQLYAESLGRFYLIEKIEVL